MSIEELQPFLSWIKNNQELCYILIFFLSLSESLVVVGLIVPGIAIMSIIGTLIGYGYLSLWPTLIAAIIGAIVGDGISYWAGEKFQQSIRDWWIFRKYPEIILRCEKFFAKHGGKSVVFGRFVGPVRPMIPAIAGMMKMPPLYFYTVNFISAIFWAPVYLMPGVIFGNSLANLPPEVSKKILYIVILVFFSIWITAKIIKSIVSGLRRRYKKAGTKIWLYVENNSINHLQKLITHPLTHKKHQVDSFLFLLTLLAITLIYTLLTKARLLSIKFNALFKHLSLMIYSPKLNKILIIIDSLSSVIPMLLLFTGFIIYFKFYENNSTHKSLTKRLAILGYSSIACYYIATLVLCYFVQYPWPFQSPYDDSFLKPYSYPNFNMGLVVLIVGLLGIIRYCSDPTLYKKSSYNFYAINTIILFLLVKLMLGYTWLSDLIGGILLASCVLLSFCVIYWQAPIENLNIKRLKLASLAMLSFLVMINSTLVYYCTNFNYDEVNSQRIYNTNKTVISYQNWLEQKDLFHDTDKLIINLQFIGDKKLLSETLIKQHWFKQPEFNFNSMLKFLENSPSIKQLPVLPEYYLDHHASISLSKIDTNNKLLNLQLWQTEYEVDDKPLWIGTIQYLKPKTAFKSITYLNHWPRAEFADATKKLEQDLKKSNVFSANFSYSSHQLIDNQFKVLFIN